MPIVDYSDDVVTDEIDPEKVESITQEEVFVELEEKLTDDEIIAKGSDIIRSKKHEKN